jgi:hypothetical protein
VAGSGAPGVNSGEIEARSIVFRLPQCGETSFAPPNGSALDKPPSMVADSAITPLLEVHGFSDTASSVPAPPPAADGVGLALEFAAERTPAHSDPPDAALTLSSPSARAPALPAQPLRIL